MIRQDLQYMFLQKSIRSLYVLKYIFHIKPYFSKQYSSQFLFSFDEIFINKNENVCSFLRSFKLFFLNQILNIHDLNTNLNYLSSKVLSLYCVFNSDRILFAHLCILTYQISTWLDKICNICFYRYIIQLNRRQRLGFGSSFDSEQVIQVSNGYLRYFLRNGLWQKT
jgi:hypothetical protein